MEIDLSKYQKTPPKPKFGKLEDHFIFENEDYIVFNKPAFMSSLQERNNTNLNLLEWVRRQYPEAILCHRIDRDTSGAIIIAKNETVYKHITLQFEHRKVKKYYHAIVEGSVNFENVNVEIPIKDLGEKVILSKTDGKKAHTIFNTLEIFKDYSLIECEILSGRRHQIRIHLASQNTRISADVLYNAKMPYLSRIKKKFSESKQELENPIVDRMMLHAYQVGFYNMQNEFVSYIAPYPKDFEVFLRLLKKYNAR